MVQKLIAAPRLLLGVLLLLVLAACGTTPQPTTFDVTVNVTGAGTGTVTSLPEGINVTSGGEAGILEVAEGTEVTLIAAAADGSIFTGWSGACTGTGLCVVEVDADVTVTATFAPGADTLTVATDGDGAGNVTSDPAGIDLDGGTASAAFDIGTEITLTATPASGSNFVGWDGACEGEGATCTFTFDGGSEITATFALSISTLNIATDGTGTGNVTSDPAGIDLDEGDASATFAFGTEITLTADADAGSYFDGWSGVCAGQGDTCTFTIEGGTTVTATFLLPATLDVGVVSGGSAGGSVASDPGDIDTTTSASGDFPLGTVVTLTATPSSGAFSGWVGGGCDDVRTPVCVVTMDASKEVFGTFNDVQTQVVRVAASGGDAVEFLGDSVVGQESDPPIWLRGWVWTQAAFLDLGWAPYHNLTEAGLRFPSVSVPSGAIVTSAVLQVTAAAANVDYPVEATTDLTLTIAGEMSPDPTGFVQPATTATTFGITLRPRTEASVNWSISGAWSANVAYQAPDATSILQEIVDQPGWGTGNAVVLFLKGGDVPEQAYRRIRSFDSGDPETRHPTLTVGYVVKPPVP